MTTAPQNYEDHAPNLTGESYALPARGALFAAPELLRTGSQVRQKLKQVMYRHLQKELRENFRQVAEGCGHNQPSDLKGFGIVHLCQYPDRDGHKPRKMLCDSRMFAGERQARECPLWKPKRDKADIKAEFRALMAAKDRGPLASKYPDIAALMWVLDGENIIEEVQRAMDEVDEGQDANGVQQEAAA